MIKHYQSRFYLKSTILDKYDIIDTKTISFSKNQKSFPYHFILTTSRVQWINFIQSKIYIEALLGQKFFLTSNFRLNDNIFAISNHLTRFKSFILMDVFIICTGDLNLFWASKDERLFMQIFSSPNLLNVFPMSKMIFPIKRLKKTFVFLNYTNYRYFLKECILPLNNKKENSSIG